MKLIDLYPYLTVGQKLIVRVPIDAPTDRNFEVEIMRDQRFGNWNDEYGDWLESLDLEVAGLFAGNDNLMITCKPKSFLQMGEVK